jgi:hypothetical protein
LVNEVWIVAAAVGRGQSSDLGGGTVHQIEAVEHRIAHDRGDLIAQGGEVGVQRLTARGVERGVRSGERLGLQLDQQVRNRLARRQGDVNRRSGVVDRVDDGRKTRHLAALVLSDGEDRTIVTGIGDFQAAVDVRLGLGELSLGGGEVLQRNVGAVICVDAKGHVGLSVLGIEQCSLGVLPA